MKIFVIIAIGILLALLGWNLTRSGGVSPATAIAPMAVRTQHSPETTVRDEAEVFRKAFWKQPTAMDRILHAERREWSDGEGIHKWQWFIALEPSPDLVKYLRDDNAFSLTASASPAAITNAPAWFSFSPGEVEVLQDPGGNMQLFFGKADGLLHATAAGGGFTKPVKTPSPSPRQEVPASNPGRLPATPPPIPSTIPHRTSMRHDPFTSRARIQRPSFSSASTCFPSR